MYFIHTPTLYKAGLHLRHMCSVNRRADTKISSSSSQQCSLLAKITHYNYDEPSFMQFCSTHCCVYYEIEREKRNSHRSSFSFKQNEQEETFVLDICEWLMSVQQRSGPNFPWSLHSLLLFCCCCFLILEFLCGDEHLQTGYNGKIYNH